MKPIFAGCLQALILVSVAATAQVPTGTPPFGSFGGGPFDVVNLGNLNAHFAIPVVQKAGRGIPFTYALTYDTSVWYPVGSSGSQVWTPVPQFGWVFPLPDGSITYHTMGTWQQPCNATTDMTLINMAYYGNFVYHAADGSSHLFQEGYSTYYGSPCTGAGNPNPTTGMASDGSGYTITAGPLSPIVVTATNGTFYNLSVPTPPVTDPNGNEITETTTGTFTDTLGQTPLTITGSNPVELTYTAPNGSPASYSVTYTSMNVKTAFGCSGIGEYTAANIPLISSVALPDGSSYGFTYEATPGHSGYTTARLTEVRLPTGGSITYSYPGANDGSVCADGSTLGLTRTLTPGGEWQYARTQVSGAHWQTSVTSPPDPVNSGSASDVTMIDFQQDGNTSYPTYNFYETQRKVYQGAATGTPLSTFVTCYNAHYASCATTGVSNPITQTDRYTQVPNGSGSLTSLTELIYTANSPVTFATDEKDYTYGVSLGSSPSATYLVREVQTGSDVFTGGSGNTIAKPTSVTVIDWSSGSANTLSYTGYSYDQTSVTSTTGTPQHATASGSRGNLTTMSTQVNGSTTLYRVFTYFDTGNVKTATDAGTTSSGGSNLTAYNYPNGTSTCGNAFPASLSEPLSLSRSFTWNCVGGVMLTATDENGQVVTADYSADPDFWRPDYVLDQLLNKTTLAYPGETAEESTLNFNSAHSVSDFRATVDGFGRPIISQRKQAPSATIYDSVETYYDVFGRMANNLLPYSGSASAPCTGTCPNKAITYDALSRPLEVTDSGGGTVSYQYIGNDVLQTVGPTQNFTNQLEYDGLGRLSSVCEVTAGTTAWPGGSCGQTNAQTGYLTKYTYDALGNLVAVKQNAQTTSNKQTRNYTYDMLSRLTSEGNPETGNSSSGSDITYTYDVACGSSYTASAGDLTKRVDKAGNTTCYSYDSLHRLKDAGNTGPTCRHFRYDTQTPPSGVTVTNTLARQAEAYTDNCASGKLTDEWFGYDADGHLSDFYESTPHSGGYYHTSASYWANGAIDSLSALTASSTAIFPTIYYGASAGTGLDGEGRVTKVSAASGTSPVSNVTYVTSGTTEPIGALTGVTLGSGDTDSFTFDPNTGRPLTYTYSVNSVNDEGSLIWNANGTLKTFTVIDSLAGTSDSQTCKYYYDDLMRLGGKDSNGYSVDCSTNWSQLFTFDPFGNISKSGTGTFAPTYSTATNQFTAIPGIVSPYYDANGNLTKDNLNTYAWDPNWGNPASINSTNLIYDAQGQMVEQQNGSTYTQMLYSPAGKTAIMNGQTLSKAFVSLPGGGTVIYNSSGLAYYRHADWLGSSRLTSTASRTVYSASAYAPFGEQYGTSGTADASFTGQDADTTSSLYDFTFREHSPTQGRWISPDPLGVGAVDPTTPQSWNRYAYVLNNPLTMVDPLGEECEDQNGQEVDVVEGICDSMGGWTWTPDTPGNGSLPVNPDPAQPGGQPPPPGPSDSCPVQVFGGTQSPCNPVTGYWACGATTNSLPVSQLCGGWSSKPVPLNVSPLDAYCAAHGCPTTHPPKGGIPTGNPTPPLPPRKPYYGPYPPPIICLGASPTIGYLNLQEGPIVIHSPSSQSPFEGWQMAWQNGGVSFCTAP